MTRQEIIKKIEEMNKLLLEEVDLELTDYARFHAHNFLVSAIDCIEENEEKDY